MERDFVVSGVHIGEHSFEPDKVLEEIKIRCVESGMKFCMIRPARGVKVLDEHYLMWARYLSENEIYFAFLYATQYPPEGENSHLGKALVNKLREVSGKFFMGEIVGESGSLFAGKLKGYYNKAHNSMHPPMANQNVTTLTEAKNQFVQTVKNFVDIDKSNGIENIFSVDPTFLNKYNMDAGITIPLVETMFGNPEIMFSAARGCVRAKSLNYWGAYIAHEWYGGMRHNDELKKKRLSLVYKYAYLSGANIILAESGDEMVNAYGEKHDFSSDICKIYRDEAQNTVNLINSDHRPQGGPKAKVAFVYGNLDGWTGSVLGSSLWGQFDREEWGNSSAEYSWRILDESGTKRSWRDIENYGSEDLSALPAYGMYDIVPAESSVEKLSCYDYLIFVGWNTMTEAIYNNLKLYVEGGGRLFMCASHLNTSDVRSAQPSLIHGGNVEDLFGCTLGETFRCNDGYKFERNSLIPEIMYPGTSTYICDPIFSNGYASYVKATVNSGYIAARLDNSFRVKNDEEISQKPPVVIENKLGRGTAILMTSMEYPGHGSVYGAYRAIVREFISASHRNCEIKVYGSDKVRFSVYESQKVYLLNTDYDVTQQVIVDYRGKKETVSLEPCELKILPLV